MREVVLDTETTGLDVAEDHRIIEIGCVELISGRRTGKVFHSYINPGRLVGSAALKIHGLDDNFLRAAPLFEAVCDSFLKFLNGSRLVIHNAPFDLGFINAELARIQKPPLVNKVMDSLELAREKFPNQSNRLDALCQRFGIDISKRTKHGALLDAGLLAEVYIALTSGAQASLLGEQTERLVPARSGSQSPIYKGFSAPTEAQALGSGARLSQEEILCHQRFIQEILSQGKKALWHQFSAIK